MSEFVNYTAQGSSRCCGPECREIIKTGEKCLLHRGHLLFCCRECYDNYIDHHDASEHNLTPDQRLIRKSTRAHAYRRIPMSCDLVRSILDEMGAQIAKDCGIPDSDAAIIDAAVSTAFQRIRDEVTQPFRTEQMRLLEHYEDL